MADSSSSSGSFPWASVALLAAFVASTQLVPHAFEALRPPEKERAQTTTVEAELPIDARLWEDPFIALRRYEAERNERCDKSHKEAKALQDCKGADALRQLPANVVRRLGSSTEAGDTLVLAALVPGNPFVGAEESRRRMRYAVLAGLQATGFLPDDAEHLGLLTVARERLVSDPSVKTQGTYSVPYELLHHGPTDQLSYERTDLLRYKRVLLLWVDESALPSPKLDALALMVTQLMGAWACQFGEQSGRSDRGLRRSLPGLAVIGPSSTDALRIALSDLRRAGETASKYPGLTREGACLASGVGVIQPPNDLQLGYWRLSQAQFYNPFSTALSRYLPELDGQTIWRYLSSQFNGIVEPVFGPITEDAISFVRTISTDDQLIAKLVTELERRLPVDRKRRIVLVTERDSLYSQSLLRELTEVLSRRLPQLEVVPAYYFRGIDGVTTREAATAALGAAKSAKDAQDESRRIEWPESRDQLDYLRRMAQSLQHSEAEPKQVPVSAIGVLGYDVHDKLLVLQALHENFADRIFFTTDMDARLLHPRVLPFTRNLVVASSLPLELPPQSETPPLDLRAGGAPFRDVYQSAAYLAARQASCQSEGCRGAERRTADRLIDQPLLYEVGRTRPLALEGAGITLKIGRADQGQGLIAGILLGLVSVGLLLWPSTPALRKLRASLVRFDPEDAAGSPRLGTAAALLSTAHLAVLAFMYVSVLEFLNPRAMSLWQPAALALCVLAPAALAVGLGRRSDRLGRPSPKLAAEPYYLLVLGAALVMLLLVWTQQGVGGCADCEPVAWFEGVSAWPSHLLHLLALVIIIGSIDLSWQHGVHTVAQDSRWLAIDADTGTGAVRRRLGWRACLPRMSTLRWSRPLGYSCDVAKQWREYVLRAAGRPRALRVLLVYLLTMAIGIWLMWLLGTGESGWGDSRILEIPVRGQRHRAMVFSVLALVLVLLPLAILAVSDATLLVYRFVTHLNQGRSVYPQHCLERFADALGNDDRADLWCQRMAAEPQQRSAAVGPQRHTLLDGWIDMQLVARRTEHIAPLVMGPFIVLGIVLLARSRVFDNWSMTPVIALTASVYLLALMLLGVLLKRAVENTRRHALAGMAADLRWLKGQSGPQAELVKPFESLMEEVKTMRGGAFAGVFDQPLLKAMLVPLGGAGGAQLLDYLSLVY